MEAALAAAEAKTGPLDFELWVTEKADALLRFAYVLTGDKSLAEDAVQDALTTACARWSRVSRADDPEAYVKRMVVNAHISWWRRFRRREAPTDDPVCRTSSGQPSYCGSTRSSRTPRSVRCCIAPRRPPGRTSIEHSRH
jgi:DNA-directed RNA polymerase specialized sigma24 family protein